MSETSHIEEGKLARWMDGELDSDGRLETERHLEVCGECTARLEELTASSRAVETMLAQVAVPLADPAERARLAGILSSTDANRIPAGRRTVSGKVMRRFAWGIAAAAALAAGILIAPQSRRGINTAVPAQSVLAKTAAAESFDLNGQSFVSLPDSDPYLPLSAARVVQMQVPVASLAQAGIMLEPATGAVEHSVMADVVFGIDGRPRGVRVLSVD